MNVDMNRTVSIIVPCFNDGQYLREAVQSAEKCQKKDACEIIIVNDGSSDGMTLEILRDMEREGHQVIHQANRGLSAARNIGIKAAGGAYILPLDSDNKIRPDYISEGIRVLEGNPRVGVVYGDCQFFGEKTGINRVPQFSLARLIQGNFIDACAIYRRLVWEEVGGYDQNMLLGWEDWEFWLRIALKNWGFCHIDAILFDYRVRENSMISKTIQHISQLCDYIFSKEELKDANAIRQRQLEVARLFNLERSPDYRLGRAVLDPLRTMRRLLKGKPADANTAKLASR
jgi:glycosyltransferase involved in cell wall biosynthesis